MGKAAVGRRDREHTHTRLDFLRTQQHRCGVSRRALQASRRDGARARSLSVSAGGFAGLGTGTQPHPHGAARSTASAWLDMGERRTPSSEIA
jgi:hypothetical protein